MSKLFSKNNPAQDIQMAAHVLAPKVDRDFDPLSIAVIDGESFNRLMTATRKRQRKAEKRAAIAAKNEGV